MTRKWYAPGFIVLITFSFGLAVGSIQHLFAYETMIRSLEVCVDQVGEAPERCIKDAVSRVLTIHTVHDVMNIIDASSAKESFSCHNAAHIVGDELATKRGDIGADIAACGSSCRYGCVHGVVAGAIRKDPNVLNNINTVCAMLPTHSVRLGCAHGLGHAFVELTGRQIEQSYRYCDGLKNSDLEHQCSNGVFMELFFPTREGEWDQPKNLSNTICSQAPQKYAHLCIMDAAVILFAQSNQITSGVSLCTSLPQSEHSRCINALGGAVFERVVGSVPGIIAHCSKAEAYNKDCLMGAITSSLVVKPTLANALAICEASELSWQAACIQFARAEFFRWQE